MTWEIYRPDEKKAKKNTGKLELNFPYMTILKALKYTPGLSFSACQKKIVEFTDSTHIIEKNLSIYVSTKYTPI